MPTPLETYLSKATGLSQRPNEFAIGTDNHGANNLLVGIQEFGPTIPHTLARSLLDSGNSWSSQSNATWVKAMVENQNMDVVHIYHIEGSEAIYYGYHVDRGTRKISLQDFERRYRGNPGSTYNEIVAVINGGFVNIECIDKYDYVRLKRLSQ